MPFREKVALLVLTLLGDKDTNVFRGGSTGTKESQYRLYLNYLRGYLKNPKFFG
jgi:hypothetical protein